MPYSFFRDGKLGAELCGCGAGRVEMRSEFGDWQEEDGSTKKEILSLSYFGSVPHLSMENLFSLLQKKKKKNFF